MRALHYTAGLIGFAALCAAVFQHDWLAVAFFWVGTVANLVLARISGGNA